MITTNISIYKDGKLEPFEYNVSGALDFSLKASELRIGNWVYFNGDKTKIDEDFFEVLFGARNYHNIEPIPLTPEILEKAGYKDLKNVFFIEGNIYWNEIKLPHIKYLHQLQNLFFCLTGEELNVNL